MRDAESGTPSDAAPDDAAHFDGPYTRDSGAELGPIDAGEPVTPLYAAGTEDALDVYPSSAGILLITRDDVAVLSADDAHELHRWTAPHPITSVDFDETTLAIADTATLTALTASLDVTSSTMLVEPCAAGVVISGPRFVCGNGDDFGRIFYTYDLGAGRELIRSPTYTYNGIPMKRVSGRDAFVTSESVIFPNQLTYFDVNFDEASLVFQSMFTSEQFTSVYAFPGVPAAQLVTHDGAILDVSTCAPGMTGCFGRVGTLGTLMAGDPRYETFLAEDAAADGSIVGLVEPMPVPLLGYALCPPPAGCEIQQTDVAARRVLRRGSFVSPSAIIVRAVRFEPATNSALVLTEMTCMGPDDCSGWQLSRVPLS